MYPAQLHLDRKSLHPKFESVCLQVHPTIVSHFELISATEKHIHLCETAGFARHARTLSFVAAKMRAVHDFLPCAFWPVEQSQAGRRSTFRAPSVFESACKGGCRTPLSTGLRDDAVTNCEAKAYGSMPQILPP